MAHETSIFHDIISQTDDLDKSFIYISLQDTLVNGVA